MKPSFEITEAFFDQYVKNKKRFKNYNKAVDVSQHLSFHIDGYFRKPWLNTPMETEPVMINPYFSRIIDQRRPSESPTVLEYRRNNYFPITRATCEEVIGVISKIPKSVDWQINYAKSESPDFIDEKDGLERYCEMEYPKYDSIENWAASSGLKWMMGDPNALVVIMPLSWDVEPGEYFRPFAHIIECRDVYEYKENEVCVFKSPYQTTYTQGKEEKSGNIFMAVTTMQFVEYRQVAWNRYEMIEHDHNIGEMPAFLMGGKEKSPDIQQPFYESFIQSMLPYLDCVAGDFSDLQAEKVQHMFSTMWYIQTSNCSVCQGSGFSPGVNSKGKQVVCSACNGTKRGPAPSPYSNYEVQAINVMGQDRTVPIPPAGFIEKTTTSMVQLIRTELDTNIRYAKCAVNMGFLNATPLVESGTAKQMDREEANAFLYKIARHLIEDVVKPIYYFVNELRYSAIIPNKETRMKQLPIIPVPENYKFLKDDDAEDNLDKISKSNIPDAMKDTYYMDYVMGKFADQPDVRNRLIAINEHDPLPGYTIQEINSVVTAGLASKEDAVLSVHLNTFIISLLSENNDFLDLDYEEQKEILYDMATEKAQELDAAAQIKKQAGIADGTIQTFNQEPNTVPNKFKQKALGMKQRKVDKAGKALDKA